MDKYNLDRFLEAQLNIYPTILTELLGGRKRSHWMWYIFPQLKGLGYSRRSNYYGISGIEEASAYLQNPILNQRLRNVCMIILGLKTDNAIEIFGEIDSQKLKSSMTLFDIVAPNDIFAKILDKYFEGKRCEKSN